MINSTLIKYLSADIAAGLIIELAAIFERRFGHLDFWRLSKRWKEIHYKREAGIIVQIIDMEIERHRMTYGELLPQLDQLLSTIDDTMKQEVISLLIETIQRVDS